MRYIAGTILLLLVAFGSYAQTLEWHAGFDGFLDNREYFNTVQHHQTMFGSRFSANIGGSYKFQHRFRGGFNYLYEFGGQTDAYQPNIVMYYQYDNEPFTFYMGAFPRKELLDYPLALLTDTLNYYRPNIEGLYLRLKGNWGHQNVFIDWTSRQTDFDFEQFMFGFSGRVNWNWLFFYHHFLMGHLAGPGIPIPNHHIRDNGGFDLNIGADLSEMLIFDTLWISLGTLISLDRTRNVDDGWQTPAGFLAQSAIYWYGFGLQGTLYIGEGHSLIYGDSFYQAKEYGRLDVFWIPFRKQNIQAKLVSSFHFIESKLDFSQQILLSISLDQSRVLKQ